MRYAGDLWCAHRVGKYGKEPIRHSIEPHKDAHGYLSEVCALGGTLDEIGHLHWDIYKRLLSYDIWKVWRHPQLFCRKRSSRIFCFQYSVAFPLPPANAIYGDWQWAKLWSLVAQWIVNAEVQPAYLRSMNSDVRKGLYQQRQVRLESKLDLICSEVWLWFLFLQC